MENFRVLRPLSICLGIYPFSRKSCKHYWLYTTYRLILASLVVGEILYKMGSILTNRNLHHNSMGQILIFLMQVFPLVYTVRLYFLLLFRHSDVCKVLGSFHSFMNLVPKRTFQLELFGIGVMSTSVFWFAAFYLFNASWEASYVWAIRGISRTLQSLINRFWVVLFLVYSSISKQILDNASNSLNGLRPSCQASLGSAKVLHAQLVRSLNKFLSMFELLIFLPLASTFIHFLTEINIVIVDSQSAKGNIGSGLVIVQDLILILVLIVAGERMDKMVDPLTQKLSEIDTRTMTIDEKLELSLFIQQVNNYRAPPTVFGVTLKWNLALCLIGTLITYSLIVISFR